MNSTNLALRSMIDDVLVKKMLLGIGWEKFEFGSLKGAGRTLQLRGSVELPSFWWVVVTVISGEEA
jgi:hypothetical protein